MILEFLTVVDDIKNKEIIEYEIVDNKYYLKDESNTIFIKNDKSLICQRNGLVKQNIIFIEKEITKSKFIDSYNIEMNFSIYTEKLIMSDKQIFIKYDLLLDNTIISKHKIWINFCVSPKRF